MENINSHMSFLELLDVLNEKLIKEDKDPIAFEHDCREGICGSCSMMINGEPHGPLKGTTACQLHMFLIVAMIIQIFQNFFVSMIDKLILEMEEYSAKILDRLYESK